MVNVWHVELSIYISVYTCRLGLSLCNGTEGRGRSREKEKSKEGHFTHDSCLFTSFAMKHFQWGQHFNRAAQGKTPSEFYFLAVRRLSTNNSADNCKDSRIKHNSRRSQNPCRTPKARGLKTHSWLLIFIHCWVRKCRKFILASPCVFWWSFNYELKLLDIGGYTHVVYSAH